MKNKTRPPNLDTMDETLKKYLYKNNDFRKIENPPTGRLFRNAIVIPAYAESEYLPRTLESIAAAGIPRGGNTMVIIVVNNPPPENSSADKISDNAAVLELLRNPQTPFGRKLNLFLIDASSPGREIGVKDGVGGARKIGMDAALCHLDWNRDPLIISLDADTTVENNYLSEIESYFEMHPEISGAAVHFEHQAGENPETDAAVTDYELFMRYYVCGLRIAGSPYAYHTLGSAMAFRAGAYVKAGGMRRRNGGEDFYFMQALRKTGIVGTITGTCVHPSSRISDRVPFGTGPRMSAAVNSEKKMKVYNPEIFFLLKKMISHVSSCDETEINEKKFNEISPELSDFLRLNAFFENWGKILKNTPGKPDKITEAFHIWFDAFRTLKFVHFCGSKFLRTDVGEALIRLWKAEGETMHGNVPAGRKEMLCYMRNFEKTIIA